MTSAEAMDIALATVGRNAVAAARRDTLHKLRIGHPFANDYGRRLVNDRAHGKFADDAEMDGAISQWLYLIAEQDRKAAERAEAALAPIKGQGLYLRSGIATLRSLLDQERSPAIVRKQFQAWIESTAIFRAGLDSRERRSIAGLQGAFNRRLRKCERLSLQRAGVCP